MAYLTKTNITEKATCLQCHGELIPGVNSDFCCQVCEDVWVAENLPLTDGFEVMDDAVERRAE